MSSATADYRFAVPPIPPHHVSRPRLLRTLDETADIPLTLASAGAGAGKTVLLADWARRQPEPVSWLALTPEDNDPRRFWRLFLEAGRVGGQSYPPSAWAAGRTVELLDSVYGRGAGPQPRLVVVLDDAHVLTHPEIVEGLDRLVHRWSRRVRLLMTARNDPLLPLHRYRLAGQVCEIRFADLAMTEAEARALLDDHGVPLPDVDLRILQDRTEGWPAGLRLAALRMQGTARPAEFVAQLAMDKGSVGEYLTEEVLAQLPEDVRRLVIETSFLDEVSGPLAAAVTGVDDSEALLAELSRNNSFVIPLNAEETVFRYHQLFREVLRHLANRQPPALVRARYARAAEWYRDRGDLPTALRWTVRSQDPAATRTLLVRGGLVEAFVGLQEIAEAGLAAAAGDVPPAGASAGELVEFEVARWAVAAASGDATTAESALSRLPPLGPELADAPPPVRLTAAVAQLVVGQLAGDHVLLDASAEQLLSDPALDGAVRDVAGLRASVLAIQARSRFTAGRLAEVEPLLLRAEAEAEAEAADVPAVLLSVLSVLAFVSVAIGRPRHADDALRRAAGLLAEHPGLHRPVALDLAVARQAELAADWAAMGEAVGRVVAAGPVYRDNGIAATVAYVQAMQLVAADELPRAAALMRHNSALNSATVGVLAVLRDRELADIEIRLGRPHSALQLLAPYQRAPVAVVVGVTAARAHLALGELSLALAQVRAVLTTPSPFVTRQLSVEAVLCEAEIADRSGEPARASELLDRAVALADGDLVLPFVRTAEVFGPLLSRHPVLAARWPAAPSDLPPLPVTTVADPAAGDLADPLTSREQAVLRLMATGMSTAQLAGELHLSVNTVKSHLAAIYRKLAVGGRRDAVYRARELELL
jgi:LuxR family transcriptional regulator, maltose regulon positive regulatory protein